MAHELESASAKGRIGLSTGLIYAPCCYAKTGELIALGACSRAGDVPIVVHMRSESDAILEALDEMLTRRAAQRLQASHLALQDRRAGTTSPRPDAVLARIDAARAAGVRLTCDQYPVYRGVDAARRDPAPVGARRRRRHDGEAPGRPVGARADAAAMLETHECSWDNFWKWTGPGGIVISQIPSGRFAGPARQDARRGGAGARRQGDPLELALDLLRDEAMGVGMVSHSQDESVVARFLALPYVNVCTDALLGGRPHPRAYGTYPRVLGRYVRERARHLRSRRRSAR